MYHRRAMTTRRSWTTAEAVVVPAREAPRELASAERYPFVSALVEGPGGLREADLVEAAIAAGASRQAVLGDAAFAARAVRSGINSGRLLALRRRPSGPEDLGSVEIEGTFTEQDRFTRDERHRLGWDAETEYMVPWTGRWTILDRSGGRVRARVTLVFTRTALVTTYFGRATPSAPHDRDGTLGAHERRHRDLARDWWTTETLNDLMARERIALNVDLPGGLGKPAVDHRCGQQVDAIARFVLASHQHLQESSLDQLGGSVPRFEGVRR
jgi:hypothetical protein